MKRWQFYLLAALFTGVCFGASAAVAVVTFNHLTADTDDTPAVCVGTTT